MQSDGPMQLGSMQLLQSSVARFKCPSGSAHSCQTCTVANGPHSDMREANSESDTHRCCTAAGLVSGACGLACRFPPHDRQHPAQVRPLPVPMLPHLPQHGRLLLNCSLGTVSSSRQCASIVEL